MNSNMNKEKLRFGLYFFWYKIKTPLFVIMAFILFPITIPLGFFFLYRDLVSTIDQEWCYRNNYRIPYIDTKMRGFLGDVEEEIRTHRLVKKWRKRARKVERVKRRRKDISIVKDIIKDVDNKRERRRFYKNLESEKQ